MKLTRAKIENFRSIEAVDVDFEIPCRVLVGINESGKSNILKALRLLGPEYKPEKVNDMREALPTEEPVEGVSVEFHFKLSKEESDEVFESLAGKLLSSAKNPEVILNGTAKRSVRDICNDHNTCLYDVDVLGETKTMKYWILPKQYKLIDGWKKPSSACPADFTLDIKGESVKVGSYEFIRAADFPELPAEYVTDASVSDFSDAFGNSLLKVAKANKPGTLFWQYDEKNLLPNSVTISEFAADPDSCVPLKNMFVLAGIAPDSIGSSLTAKQQGTNNQFQNYLNQIAAKTTAHFREVWKEYRDIEFSLRLDAGNIIPGVKEQNTHDFERRSDGFKRFVTFLLMISVNVKTDHLRNTLLLIDEPDSGLHPSGARYLRDELIRIAKKNYVVYSTHSIFMIDSAEIGRHYIVSKEDETTSITDAETSNIADEEVLFNALGHSVFAVLKEHNLIFEGWNDKRLFQVALPAAPAALRTKFADVNICHAKGVGTFRTITPMIELANRKCLIISDADTAAKQSQKVYKQEKGFGTWLTYKEVDASIQAVTGEDFLKNNYIATQVNNAIAGGTLPAFTAAELPADAGKLVAVTHWLTANGMTADQAKDTTSKIKDALFENLTATNIEDTYRVLLQSISLA